MSRIVKIRGQLLIKNVQLALQAISDCNLQNFKVENRFFLFQQYDYLDGKGISLEIERLENYYKQLLTTYYERIAVEKRKLEEAIKMKKLDGDLLRLEQLKQIEVEKKQIDKEKKKIRESKRTKIIEQAKKKGYVVKTEVSENNQIKLVLQKRIY